MFQQIIPVNLIYTSIRSTKNSKVIQDGKNHFFQIEKPTI